MKTQSRAHEATGFPAARIFTFPEELERAGRDPCRLFPQRLAGLAAPSQAHPSKPIMQASAEFDLTRATADCLCLKVQQDHARSGAIGNANHFGGTLTS